LLLNFEEDTAINVNKVLDKVFFKATKVQRDYNENEINVHLLYAPHYNNNIFKTDIDMNKQFKNKINGFETRPKVDEETFCCVHSNTGPVALENCSHKEFVQEETQGQVQTLKEDPMEVYSVCDLYEYGNRLIHRQDEIIRELSKQICDGEKELLEKERQIAQLENDIEDICRKLFSEVNLSC
jgi:hypothetical protein